MVRPTIEPNSNLEPNLRFEFGSVDRTTTLGKCANMLTRICSKIGNMLLKIAENASNMPAYSRIEHLK